MGRRSNTNLSGSDKRRRKAALLRRDGGLCARCGHIGDLTIDHIVPRALGGSNKLSNLQLLCEPCNQDKGATLDGTERTIIP